ncbi:S1/P1 nuclease [Pontibacter mucosus]|uniref:S1/P1 nuclease n=1 Tax=Pontibacter mucosus TaxID=1649266 RepID=A0A2T5YG95_9BACT|nr:S1/P1 nuclease [Pontibacter mucosus]PTX18342.1 S1/P1 nuclease [Pontibacter mucosus]
MKKISGIFFLCLLLCGQAFAWGQNGHRAVGQVAEQHLSKKARKKIMNLLNDNSLAEVSVWMDDIKSDKAYDHTHDWHWVTIQDGQTYEQAEKNPNGDIVEKIEEITKTLKAGNLDKAKEQELLKYLVHLVGDIHQPLHVGGGDDQGGNAVKVQWFYQPSNLHRVWDSDMIDGKNLSFTEIVRFLGEPGKEQVKQWQAATVRDWAYESMKYRPQVYNLPEDKKLGYRYAYENYSLVEQRLLQAGIRLAGLLNEIYG